jgi:hypothetical protein
VKNSDLPAMPIGEQIDTCHLNAPCNGLTKREHFAVLAMQSLINGGESRFITIAKSSLKAADALLAELDKVQE